VLAPVAARRLHESHGPRPNLDLPGVALAAAGALGVTWSLVRGGAAGWSSPEVLGALGAGIALLAAFAAWERRAAEPMIPPALLSARGFMAANGVSFFMYAGLFGALFLMSQLLQTAMGYDPLSAGLRLLPWSAPPMVVAPLAGALADRYGNRPFMVLGLALQAVGYAWVAASVHAGSGYGDLGPAFVVSGIGTSLCFPTVANAVMGAVPAAEAGVASGINSSMRELGGVLGVAVLASVFAHHGGYASPATFVGGFTPALWVAVGFSALGILAALRTAAPRRATVPAAVAPEAA